MSIPKRKATRTSAPASHYFDRAPGARSRPRQVQLDVGERTLKLATDAGVFAHGHLDAGTRVLLAAAPVPPSAGDLLDLGCGYGPIALWLGVRAPGARVWAVDVNQRALELTRANATTAGLGNVGACLPEDVPAGVRFAAVYSNPPVRVGKQALHELLLAWLGRLEAAAAAYLVVQHHLGSDSLAGWLGSEGWAVRRLASKQGYRVLEVRSSGGGGSPSGRDFLRTPPPASPGTPPTSGGESSGESISRSESWRR